MFQPLRSSGVYPFTQTKDFGFNISLPSTETSLDFESGDRCFSPPENSNDETYQPHTKAIAKSQNKKSDKHKNFELKLKTEPCKMYTLGFVCPYGDKCSFAHGASELKQKVTVMTSYKTIRCTKFHKKSYCQYGSRCQFIHRKIKKGGFKGMKTKYQQVLDFMDNSSLVMHKSTMEKSLTQLLSENSLETYKLPKLKVFELFRS